LFDFINGSGNGNTFVNRDHIKDYLNETQLIQRRLLVASASMVILTGLLVIRIWYLQVHEYNRYTTLSKNNRIRLLPIPPVRGRIFDRQGHVLAQNVTVFNLEVIPDQVPDMNRLLDQLGQVVTISQQDIDRFKRLSAHRPGFESQTLRTNLNAREASRFAVNRHRFRGVELRARLQRSYPEGGLFAHLLGYVGKISLKDLKRIEKSQYRGTDYIGKSGIESRYELQLLGRPGFEQVETNAYGRVVRRLSRKLPVAGDDLYLNLDIGLQQAATDALAGRRGAVVAVDPVSGGILAMVTSPSYDPNLFVNGIGQDDFAALRNNPDRPLIDRTLQGRYAPGSTIKPILGVLGQENGWSTDKTVFCPGYFRLPGRTHQYRDWKRGGHGKVKLDEAITQSCDVYFYTLARSLGIQKIHDFMVQFGLGVRTGIDLGGESSGLVPDPAWKRRVRGKPWYPGETVVAGIGQGYMLATPLQLAVATATLSQHGQRRIPYLVASKQSPGEKKVLVQHGPQPPPVRVKHAGSYRAVLQAMTHVVHGRRGTARRMGRHLEYKMAGKSGTAQVIGIAQGKRYKASEIAERFRDHALFVAFAPFAKPRIAVAVVLENAGGGSHFAAPVVRQMIDYYLLDQYQHYNTYAHVSDRHNRPTTQSAVEGG